MVILVGANFVALPDPKLLRCVKDQLYDSRICRGASIVVFQIGWDERYVLSTEIYFSHVASGLPKWLKQISGR